MIRIISTPVFAIHRKKSYIHIDINPEDLLKKLSMKRTIRFKTLMLYLDVNMTLENSFLH